MLNSSAFQTVDFPEIVDKIIKYITLPKDYAKTEGCITGWFPNTLNTHSGAVVNILPNNETNEQLATRLNLDKVDTRFQYIKNISPLMLVQVLLVKIDIHLDIL